MAVPAVLHPPLCPSTASRRVTPVIARRGYLVAPAFAGRVIATFRHAVHIRCGETIVTLASASTGDGPATLLLRGAYGELGALVRHGDAAVLRDGWLHAGSTSFDATRAHTWRPSRPSCTLTARARQRRLDHARRRLAAVRRDRPSALSGVASARVSRIAAACRERNLEDAVATASALVGLGEGLTPAGDDFLVGLLAGLRANEDKDRSCGALVESLCPPLAAARGRTTPLAAQSLGFAARGHFDALVLRTLDALLCEEDDVAFARSLDAALAAGATSGADLLTGMLAGIGAWQGNEAWA